MTEVTLSLALVTALAGALAGALGGMLGLGGGVFLVPLLVQGLGVPITEAAAVSLTTVIATSNAISSSSQGRYAINLRLGFMLELFTAGGGLIGSLIATAIAPRVLMITFSVVMAMMSAITFLRRDHSNNLPESADPGAWGGRFVDDRTDQIVTYRVVRMPLAIGTSFGAGILSTLLGLGGGVVKVPILNAWCGVPMRVASATSAFMFGGAGVPRRRRMVRRHRNEAAFSTGSRGWLHAQRDRRVRSSRVSPAAGVLPESGRAGG